MERRINNKIGLYIRNLKDDFKLKLQELELDNEKMYDILNFVYTYDHLTIEKSDLQKRKRVKNVVPFCHRCKAKRANGEQCSRRRKEESDYCGTHIKGIPHGKISSDKNDVENNKKNGWQGRLCWNTPFICSYNKLDVSKKKGYLVVKKLKN